MSKAFSLSFKKNKRERLRDLSPTSFKRCYFNVSLMSFFVKLPMFSRMAVSPFKFSKR